MVKTTRQHDRQADETAVHGPTRTLLGRAWRSCKSHANATPTLCTSSPSHCHSKSIDSAKEAKAAALVAQRLRRRTSKPQVPSWNPSYIPYPISHIPRPALKLSISHIPRPALKLSISHIPYPIPRGRPLNCPYPICHIPRPALKLSKLTI